MGNVLKMRVAAWGALVLIVMWLVFQLNTPEPWWSYISIFFAFMMTFCHLAALYVWKISKAASRKLDVVALVMGVLFVISLITLWIVML